MKKRKKPKGLIVAIDGPAGSGKSTVSRYLAQQLGGILLDTGAMYRSLAFHARNRKLQSEKEIGNLARDLDFSVDPESHNLLVNGEDLGTKIRTEEIGRLASDLSKLAEVRKVLSQRQRELGEKLSREKPVVAEGRDMGTVVFPDAEHKFFLTASAEVKADRRFKERVESGESVSKASVEAELRKRDHQDETRLLAALRPAKDAKVIDSSGLTVEEVVEEILNHMKKK